MTQIIDYEDSHRDEWSTYVNSRKEGTICHRIEWREIISSTLGHVPYYLMAMEGDHVCGVVPFFLVSTWWRRRYLVSIPWLDYGGILADNAEVEKALLGRAIELGKQLSVEFVDMRSVHAALDETGKRLDKVTFVMDISAGEEEVWKGFHFKLRNHIRKSEKSGITAEFGRAELLDDFYTVFATNMRDLGTPVWGKNLFERVLTDLPEDSELVIVRREGRAIGGGLVLSHRNALYVPSSSSYRSERSKCPNHALFWAAIKRGIAKGRTQFDFGRSTVDGATYQFKKQWTPDPLQLNWQYVLINAREMHIQNPDNENFNLAIRLWQKLPLPVANLLGPRVIKNFP